MENTPKITVFVETHKMIIKLSTAMQQMLKASFPWKPNETSSFTITMEMQQTALLVSIETTPAKQIWKSICMQKKSVWYRVCHK